MPNWRLPLSNKPAPGSPREVLDRLLSPSVLWCLFGVFVATSGIMLGISLHTTTSNNDDDDAGGGSPYDAGFFNLVSQVLVTVLASYCTLIPVLHAHLRGGVDLRVNVVVFYVTVAAALGTAVAAPAVYVARGEHYEDKSNTLNFASSVFSVITASQLATGVLRLGRGG